MSQRSMAIPAGAAVIPVSEEVFSIKALASRHPGFLTESRIRWAIRNRRENGLAENLAVLETRSGELLIDEPKFLLWYFKLDARNKPRASYRKARQDARPT